MFCLIKAICSFITLKIHWTGKPFSTCWTWVGKKQTLRPSTIKALMNKILQDVRLIKQLGMFSSQHLCDPKFRFVETKFHQGLRKLSQDWNAIDHRMLMVNENKIGIKKICTGRESNPGLPRGRREFYHWTTSACLNTPTSYKSTVGLVTNLKLLRRRYM